MTDAEKILEALKQINLALLKVAAELHTLNDRSEKLMVDVTGEVRTRT